jgi:hypothetical protein
VWDGGLGIWGGIAAGTLAGVWVLRRRGADIPRFLDAAAPALLVAQAIGRIGNYFNQELFGGPTDLPWALQISPAHRPTGYEQFATFHPTFLYELAWDLGLAAALVWLGHRRRIRAPGLFALYVAGYSLGRIGEELLRVDPAHHILGLRLNFYVATMLFVAGLAWFAWIQRGWLPWRAMRRGSTLAVVGAAVALCGCGRIGPASAATTASTYRSPDRPYGTSRTCGWNSATANQNRSSVRSGRSWAPRRGPDKALPVRLHLDPVWRSVNTPPDVAPKVSVRPATRRSNAVATPACREFSIRWLSRTEAPRRS